MAEIIFTDKDFQKKVLEAKGVVFVDFWASWCGPCQAMLPIVEQLGKEYQDKQTVIGKLNVDENQETAGKYGVMSIPTFIVFKKGTVKAQLHGMQSLDSLKEMINNVLKLEE